MAMERPDGEWKSETRALECALAALAECPDFQPQIAGRNWKPTETELAEAMDAAELRGKESGGRTQSG